MRLYYALKAKKPNTIFEDRALTETMLMFYQDLKKLPVFEAVTMMNDKNTGEYMILAISIEIEDRSQLVNKIQSQEARLIDTAKTAEVLISINLFEATLCDDNFDLMLQALNHAAV